MKSHVHWPAPLSTGRAGTVAGQSDDNVPPLADSTVHGAGPSRLRDSFHIKLEDARQPKRTEAYYQQQIAQLKAKVRNSQKMAYAQRKLISQLRAETNSLGQASSRNKLLEKLVHDSISQDFLLSQLKQLQKKPKGRRYTEYDKNFALALHYCSPKAYLFLRKTFCLPTVRSLRRWLSALDVRPGLNESVLKILQMKADSLPVAEKLVCVVIDEIALKEHISYDARSDLFEGFVEGADKLVHTTQALTVMIKGLKRGHKQVVGYYLTHNAMPGAALKDIVIDVLTKIRQTGFIPKVLVCDRGQNNISMRRLLGVTTEKPFFEMEGERIFLHDPPHLLKATRNNLKKFDFLQGDKIYKWGHIREFYDKDKDMVPRMAPKLRNIHLELPPFSPMRVCLAAQTLSHSVSRGILTHVSLGSMEPSAAHTAGFIEKLDCLFDSFNSSRLHDAKPYKRGLKDASLHWKLWEEMESSFREIRILNSRIKNPACLAGWIDNIHSVRLLWEELRDLYEFQFLLLRRLTQDCIENLFSVIRFKGGNNSNPDACKFRSSIRAVMMNNMLHPADRGNSEYDIGEFLVKKQDIQSRGVKIISDQCQHRDKSSNDTFRSDMLQNNATAYVTGWACSKLPHKECRAKLTSETAVGSDDILIALKKYEKARMYFPLENAKMLGKTITSIFHRLVETFLLESSGKVKLRLKQKVSVPPNFDACESCLEVFIDKFLNVMFNAFIKKENEGIRQKMNKRNKKAIKVLHE